MFQLIFGMVGYFAGFLLSGNDSLMGYLGGFLGIIFGSLFPYIIAPLLKDEEDNKKDKDAE